MTRNSTNGSALRRSLVALASLFVLGCGVSDRWTRASEETRGAGYGGAGGATNGGAGYGGAAGSAASSVTSGGAGYGATGVDASKRGEWSATVMPNAPGSDLPHIQRYTVGVDAVHDEVTGLTWQRTLAIYYRDLEAAKVLCEGLELDGKGGFRVPRLLELATLIDYLRDSRAIDESVFNVGTFSVISSTEGVYSSGPMDWLLDFSDGSPTQDDSLPGTLCVSGGPSGELPPHYTKGTDTVADNWTGLTWAPGAKTVSYVYEDAAAYCDSLAIDGMSFRLPSYTELLSVWDFTMPLPNLDERTFNFYDGGPGFWIAPTPRMAPPDNHTRIMVGSPWSSPDPTVTANLLCVH